MTTQRRLDNSTSGKPRFTIAAIGEVLWDVFPTGPRFGGAPANFACTSAGLAGRRASVAMVSAVGNDDLGLRAIDSLREQDVDTSVVARLDKPTGEVRVTLDETGSASYKFAEDCAWDNIDWSRELAELAARSDAVCFGTLGQRSELSRATIRRFVRSTPLSCLRIFDVNLRPPFYTVDVIRDSLQLANVLKLNDEELPLLAELFGLTGNEAELLTGLADTCGLDIVALTRGADGAAILRDGVVDDFGGVSTAVVDTVGAGDAFTASVALGILQGKPTDEINRQACEVAAFVCSQAGATPKLPERLVTAAVA